MPEELARLAQKIEYSADLIERHGVREDARVRRMTFWLRIVGSLLVVAVALLALITTRSFQATGDRIATRSAVEQAAEAAEATRRANCGLFLFLLRQRDEVPPGLTEEQRRLQDEFYQRLQDSVTQLGCEPQPAQPAG
jgi:hypothetical protein